MLLCDTFVVIVTTINACGVSCSDVIQYGDCHLNSFFFTEMCGIAADIANNLNEYNNIYVETRC